MIKATKRVDKLENVVEYPKLMHSYQGRVVLFTSHSTGVLLNEVGHNCGGYYSDDWCMAHFEDYDGSITLQNAKEEK